GRFHTAVDSTGGEQRQSRRRCELGGRQQGRPPLCRRWTEAVMRNFTPFFHRFGWPEATGSLPFCIGHRGASGHVRENTLAAFRLASELGAEMWELDTQLTLDGVVVVSHDDHLQRVFGVDRTISQMTAAELAALRDVDVPTFAEVAALARELG